MTWAQTTSISMIKAALKRGMALSKMMRIRHLASPLVQTTPTQLHLLRPTLELAAPPIRRLQAHALRHARNGPSPSRLKHSWGLAEILSRIFLRKGVLREHFLQLAQF